MLAQPEAGWSNLGADLHDADTLHGWVSALRTHFGAGLSVPEGDISERAVKSTLHLGLLSRLISPWIDWSLTTGRPSVPALEQLWWKPDGTTQFSLGVETTSMRTSTRSLGFELRESIIDPLNALGLVASSAVMWGNAASAINGATTTIIAARPELALPARRLGRDLIAHLPPGQHTGDLAHPTFRRQSCCLINTLTPQTRDATCGDCIHTDSPQR